MQEMGMRVCSQDSVASCEHNCHMPGCVGRWKGSTFFGYDLMFVLTVAWSGRTKSCHSPGFCWRRCHEDSADRSRQSIFREVYWGSFIDTKKLIQMIMI